MTPQAYIKMQALELLVGESTNTYCPFCGATHEAKLSLTRKADGILYNCYRASCGRGGFVTSSPSNWARADLPKRPVHKEYETEELPDDIRDFIQSAYGISYLTIEAEGWTYARESNRLIMPLRSRLVHTFGLCAKALPSRFGKASSPKVLMHYTSEDALRLHFPLCISYSSNALVLVEDILSATKLAALGIPTAALLGTHISTEVLSYLATQYESLTVALDPDATVKALRLKAEAELFFLGGIIVVPMRKDPKDTPESELLMLFKPTC